MMQTGFLDTASRVIGAGQPTRQQGGGMGLNPTGWVGDAIGATAGIVGGKLGAKAQENAAKLQAQATDKALAFQRQQADRAFQAYDRDRQQYELGRQALLQRYGITLPQAQPQGQTIGAMLGRPTQAPMGGPGPAGIPASPEMMAQPRGRTIGAMLGR